MLPPSSSMLCKSSSSASRKPVPFADSSFSRHLFGLLLSSIANKCCSLSHPLLRRLPIVGTPECCMPL